MKVCGVTMAMLQGHSWAPHRSNDSGVNMGTTHRSLRGKPRCQVTPMWWGGGPVVVRTGESPVHGEGVQHVAASDAEREGRR